jgi:glutathione S-transferase
VSTSGERGVIREDMQIVGRSSSLFTRVALIVAHEVGVELELVVIRDMASVDPATFGGHPALKLPLLQRDDGSIVVGTENICRVLVESGTRRRIVWPEDVRDDLGRNAQEMIEHAMAAQVQWVMGTIVGKLDGEHPFFAKGRAGFEGALRWLDTNVESVVAALPDRDASLFEIELFCLVEHLVFRASLPVAPYPALVAFANAWSQRKSARATVFRFD